MILTTDSTKDIMEDETSYMSKKKLDLQNITQDISTNSTNDLFSEV